MADDKIFSLIQSDERTGIFSRIDGDIAYMDGNPYLIGQQLKQLFGADNVPALHERLRLVQV
ncbi:hypothetical protein [Paenibacillus kribbensis]|uniref:hypothetical protein n=1 Tax=Paenibacillus kribbensis TaxID=172713 RepID=UPI000838B709|nr:hypothetical protein [Paenibacillus kribbensis]